VTNGAFSARGAPAPVSGFRKADRVYDHLRSELVDGEHAPGAELSVVAIAARLGVSRQPVMDAVRRLQEGSFLEVVPQVGVRVVSPTVRDVEDFYLVFAALEGVVTGLAAERRDEADVAWLRGESDAMTRSVQTGGLSRAVYRQLYRRVHGAIHQVARSSVAAASAQASWDRSDFFQACFGTYEPADVREMDAGHTDLIAAIEAGDPVRARRVAEEHILESRDRVVRAMSGSTP